MSLPSVYQNPLFVLDVVAPTDEPRKVCIGCVRPLPRHAFYKDVSRPDGLRERCKTCYRAHEAQKHTDLDAPAPTPVECTCGCGMMLPPFTVHGTPSRYAMGHSRRGEGVRAVAVLTARAATEPVPTKVCQGCELPLPLDAFHNDKTRRDGKRERCKACWSAHDTERRAAKAAWIAGGCDGPDPTKRVIKGIERPRYSDPRYQELRMSVFARDNYRCVACGHLDDNRDGKMNRHHLHHIKEWATHIDLRYEPTNCETRCYDCHIGLVHGKARKDRVQIECRCGCGALINAVDKYGKNRYWVKGHANRCKTQTLATTQAFKATIAARRPTWMLPDISDDEMAKLYLSMTCRALGTLLKTAPDNLNYWARSHGIYKDR